MKTLLRTIEDKSIKWYQQRKETQKSTWIPDNFKLVMLELQENEIIFQNNLHTFLLEQGLSNEDEMTFSQFITLKELYCEHLELVTWLSENDITKFPFDDENEDDYVLIAFDDSIDEIEGKKTRLELVKLEIESIIEEILS